MSWCFLLCFTHVILVIEELRHGARREREILSPEKRYHWSDVGFGFQFIEKSMSICATNTYGFLPGWWWLCKAGCHLMKSDQLTQHPSYSWQSDFVIKTQFIIPVGVFLPISLPPIHFSWSHSIVFLSVDNSPMAPNFNISEVNSVWCLVLEG